MEESRPMAVRAKPSFSPEMIETINRTASVISIQLCIIVHGSMRILRGRARIVPAMSIWRLSGLAFGLGGVSLGANLHVPVAFAPGPVSALPAPDTDALTFRVILAVRVLAQAAPFAIEFH